MTTPACHQRNEMSPGWHKAYLLGTSMITKCLRTGFWRSQLTGNITKYSYILMLPVVNAQRIIECIAVVLLTISLLAASLIFSTFASESPFTLHSARLVVIWIPLIVQIPTDFNFLISAAFCGGRGRVLNLMLIKRCIWKVNQPYRFVPY